MNRAVTAVLVVTSLLAGGHTVYSARQISLPSRTALKVTTDPANVWSWHKEILLSTGNSTLRERVLVDFNGNGRMDTEDPELRVSVTDLQFALPANPDLAPGTIIECWLTDSQRRRWVLFKTGLPFPPKLDQSHLATPLVLEPGSELFVEIAYRSPSPLSVEVNLIGRVIVL